ncbi:MAG TPA: hypothetical protein VNU68_35390 [Verrucomicrobiae bacterium]|nr:hypothetical protein [Verrucomicrobiae bacterium]
MIERIMEGIRTHGRGYVMQNPYVVAHHVRRSSSSGTGVKPPDTDCCGLCAAHHSELHQRGEKTCATEWGLDLMEEAARIAAASRMLGFLPESAA